MKNINFSANWNNKLDCISFSSIRLADDKKYIEGEYYTVCLNHTAKSLAHLVQVKKLTLNQITEGMARLDTGKSLEETKRLLRRIYAKHSVNWSEQQLCWLLFQSNNTIKNG